METARIVKGEKMKAKTKFMKMYYKLPENARKELVVNYATNPMSLNVVSIEVRNETNLGKGLLSTLGYIDS